MRKRLIFLLSAVVQVAALLSAQEPAVTRLTGDQVMANLVRAFEPVRDFSVSIEAEVNLDRLQVPSMTATLYFKRPNKIFLESPGFAMVPREGIVVNPEVLRQQFEARVEGVEGKGGEARVRLRLLSRDVTAGRRQVLLWVNPANWTVTRTESVPYEGRSVETQIEYAHVDGTYWLPQRMTTVMKAEAADSSNLGMLGEAPGGQQLSEMRRAPRTGTVTVQYKDYRVNTGLSDDLFQPHGKE